MTGTGLRVRHRRSILPRSASSLLPRERGQGDVDAACSGWLVCDSTTPLYSPARPGHSTSPSRPPSECNHLPGRALIARSRTGTTRPPVKLIQLLEDHITKKGGNIFKKKGKRKENSWKTGAMLDFLLVPRLRVCLVHFAFCIFMFL